MRSIAISNDEVRQLRALRLGFIEAIPKDLSPESLLARVLALVSLPQEVPPLLSPPAMGKLRIDSLARVAYWNGQPLDLAKVQLEDVPFVVEL